MILMILGKINRCESEVTGCTRARVPQAYPPAGVWKLPLSDSYRWLGWASAQKSDRSFCPSHTEEDPLAGHEGLAFVPGTPYFLF